MKMIGEGFLQIDKKDFIKSLIIFAFTPLIMSVAGGNIPMTIMEFIPLAKAGVSAAAAYVVKNFLTNSNDQFLKKEPKDGE